jgi:hypothetical protein
LQKYFGRGRITTNYVDAAWQTDYKQHSILFFNWSLFLFEVPFLCFRKTLISQQLYPVVKYIIPVNNEALQFRGIWQDVKNVQKSFYSV